MKKTLLSTFLLFLIIFFSAGIIFGQVTKERIGSEELIKNGINYYNYSDKDKVNIEIGIWGYIKSPGKYLIPQGTTFLDLITLSGGPLTDAKLSDVRIVRPKNDSLNIKEDKVIVLNYSDFLQEEKIQSLNRTNPILMAGDIILVPGLQKSMFRENFSLMLTAISTIASVAVLLVTILKN